MIVMDSKGNLRDADILKKARGYHMICPVCSEETEIFDDTGDQYICFSCDEVFHESEVFDDANDLDKQGKE